MEMGGVAAGEGEEGVGEVEEVEVEDVAAEVVNEIVGGTNRGDCFFSTTHL